MSRTAPEPVRTDADLVRQAQAGDTAAYAELVARYQDRVFNTCYRMCQNTADAQDLTQTAFLRALENLGRFESRANFYTWVFRIAVNLAISHRRETHRRTAVSLDEAAASGAAAKRACEAGVSEPLEQRELQERVHWALGQLESEFRAAVILKDIEEMDYAAIAEVLDVPIGTVKSRIHRGRLMLRDLLRDERMSVDRAQAG